MSSNFEYRYVSLTPEHTASGGVPRTYGTASATAAAQVYGEVDDESFAHMFDLLTRADISRYGAAKSLNGKEHSEGGLNLVAQPDDFCGMLLYAAYGDNAAANSGNYVVSSNTHTWNEGTGMILPSFTIKVGREDAEHKYTGMCLSRLAISGAVGEYTTMSADFTGQAESGTIAVQTPTFVGSASEGLHFAEGTVRFSADGNTHAVSGNILNISMEINTNLNTDYAFSLGDRTLVRSPEPQMREITGSLEFSRPVVAADASTDNPSYDQLIAEGGLLYQGDVTDPAIELKFTNGTGIIELSLLDCRWEAPSMNVSGRDSSTMTVGFVGLVDVTTNKMSVASITTDATTIGRYSTL